MALRGCFSLILGVLCAVWIHAADLPSARSTYEASRDQLVSEYASRMGALGDQYVASLRESLKQAREKGDETGAVSIAGELDRFEKERQLVQDTSDRTLMILRSVLAARDSAPARQATALPTTIPPPAPPATPPATTNAGAKAAPAVPPGRTPGSHMAHAAVGAEVKVSSTHVGESGESSPAALVDGDLFTRWSSDYSEPQEVVLTLPRPLVLTRMRVHWEKASASKYCVFLSVDGQNWKSVYLYMNIGSGEAAARVDDVDLKQTPARFIRLDLQSCVNKEWGFSMYEVEVTGSESPIKGGD